MSTMSYNEWRDALAGRELPLAAIDVDAFDRNIGLISRSLGAAQLRPATKSLRVPWLMARIAEKLADRISGWMLYSAREAELVARHHETRGLNDFLIAYPVATPSDAARLIGLAESGRTIRAVVDSTEHLELFRATIDATPSVATPRTFSVIIDIDAAWRPLAPLLGGPRSPHIGVRRSPLRSPSDAVALAQRARALGLHVSGIMAYEAQVAGIRDTNPGSRHLDPLRRLIRRGSPADIATRRGAIVGALRRAGFDLEIVNGGGSGSLLSTTRDPSITEVTAGSGFLGPHLFSGYLGLPFESAAFFALPTTRFPDSAHITCGFGGFIASGATGRDRSPIVHLPAGLAPLSAEGFGEVQTPLHKDAGHRTELRLGDPVICRHAKSGEIFEHFNTVSCLSAARAPTVCQTYRGLGLALS